MGYRDKLKESQNTMSQRPRLDIILYLDMKNNLDEKPAFHYVDKDESGKIIQHFFTKPVSGVYIGQAMKLSCWDQSSSGFYKTTAYFSKESRISLFDNYSQYVMTGNLEDIEKYCIKNVSTAIKKQRTIYLLTDKGIIEISTNLSISIYEFKVYSGGDKDRLLDYLMVLNPKLYNEKDEFFTEKIKKLLGALAVTNPPKYASISQGEPITEQLADKLNIEQVADEFLEWKNYYSKNVNKEGEGIESGETKKEVAPLVDEEPKDLNDPESDIPF